MDDVDVIVVLAHLYNFVTFFKSVPTFISCHLLVVYMFSKMRITFRLFFMAYVIIRDVKVSSRSNGKGQISTHGAPKLLNGF